MTEITSLLQIGQSLTVGGVLLVLCYLLWQANRLSSAKQDSNAKVREEKEDKKALDDALRNDQIIHKLETKMEKMQNDSDAKMQKMQSDYEAKMQKMQSDYEAKLGKVQNDHAALLKEVGKLQGKADVKPVMDTINKKLDILLSSAKKTKI